GFKVDILDPSNALNLLLGEPIDLFSFRLPRLDLSLGAGFGFDFDVLSFNIQASARVIVDLGVVYDTTGLRRIVDSIEAGSVPDFTDILDGFYIDNNPFGPEASLTLSISGGGSVGPVEVLGVTVFELAANASLSGGVAFDIKDPNNDGQLRLDEVFAITNDFADPLQVFNLFDIVGSISASFDFEGTLLGITVSASDLGIPLQINLSLSLQDILGAIGFLPNPPAEVAEYVPVVPVPGEGATGLELRLNTGPFASARIFGDSNDDDGGVNYTISDGPGGTIRVTAFGTTKDYAKSGALPDGTIVPVTRITGYGSEFGDTFNFSGLTDPTIRTVILGGGGNDVLIGGAGISDFYGEEGNDR
ncbi:MAG: hypothetical protein KC983_04090, partial [Phycisphaerales bacterium]|nr:hypothetical protein [Phycisphaerales bacterium]